MRQPDGDMLGGMLGGGDMFRDMDSMMNNMMRGFRSDMVSEGGLIILDYILNLNILDITRICIVFNDILVIPKRPKRKVNFQLLTPILIKDTLLKDTLLSQGMLEGPSGNNGGGSDRRSDRQSERKVAPPPSHRSLFPDMVCTLSRDLLDTKE